METSFYQESWICIYMEKANNVKENRVKLVSSHQSKTGQPPDPEWAKKAPNAVKNAMHLLTVFHYMQRWETWKYEEWLFAEQC
jgi:hypothetical protein